MNLQIHSVRFDADKKLIEHVQEKAQKLKNFHDRILEVEVYLKLDNIVHNIKDKVAEIKVHVPKHTFFVKHESKTFESSFDLALKAIINQIKHKKEKDKEVDSADIESTVASEIESIELEETEI
jgi:putative sigma-54 modulation protein